MDQFVTVAFAHFLALLVPGVDFFLILRTALLQGWRSASGVCLGVACANALFIAAAFAGLHLLAGATVFMLMRGLGGAFLVYVGLVFLRAKTPPEIEPVAAAGGPSWRTNWLLGFASGVSNPKNVLFYVSLAVALGPIRPATMVGYGLWMFSVVLGWDLALAALISRYRNLRVITRWIPWITKIAGVFLTIFGASLIIELFTELVS
ncbi:LysE family translocator [Kocuria sp.]|uniref:LysE family translocator n=1 Tax=Kocuria sp. TaxID=1871328 RepID=UPI0026E07BFA|nr:LysE family translocator [Kocuria sp.]MDO5617534.1 LysE family translocator [Kocuria sp.]